jgi:hypothetical protein
MHGLGRRPSALYGLSELIPFYRSSPTTFPRSLSTPLSFLPFSLRNSLATVSQSCTFPSRFISTLFRRRVLTISPSAADPRALSQAETTHSSTFDDAPYSIRDPLLPVFRPLYTQSTCIERVVLGGEYSLYAPPNTSHLKMSTTRTMNPVNGMPPMPNREDLNAT